MNNEPLISVAIATYNHEKYIRQALDSVISQSLFSEVEILIWDDGSSDKTKEIVEEYKNKYSCIRTKFHSNVGISENVFDMYNNCKGKYIAVLEGDDYWIDNKKLQKQVDIIMRTKCIAVASNSRVENDYGEVLGYKSNYKTDRIVSKKEVEREQTDLWMPSTLLFKNLFIQSNTKNIAIKNASKMGGNHSGLINLLGSIGKIYIIADAMAAYRFNQGSNGTNYSSKKHDKIEDDIVAFKKYIYYSQAFGLDYSRQYSLLYCRINSKMSNIIMKNMTFKEKVKFNIMVVLRTIFRKF